MELIKALQNQWTNSARFRHFHAGMCLTKHGVALGADTLIARRMEDGGLEFDDVTLLTLLSVAYGGPVESKAALALRRASRCARTGDESLAAMEVALALPAMGARPDGARRLHIAGGLIDEGIAPRDIWAALDFDVTAFDALAKLFNPDQPRVPEGSGRTSGRWTNGGATEQAEGPFQITPALDAAEGGGAAAFRVLPRLLPLAARFAGPIALLSALLYSTDAGGRRLEGDIPGHPDLKYQWAEDETQLRIVRRSDGTTVFGATASGGDKFIDKYGRIIARRMGDKIDVDASTFSPDGTPLLQTNAEADPNFCPKPELDKPGRKGPKGEKDRDYEDYVKLLTNPDNPTPRGFAYFLPNPMRGGNLVSYDDCQKRTGIPVEAKSGGYSDLLLADHPGPRLGSTYKMLNQATRQEEGSRGRPLIWYFESQTGAERAQELFNGADREIYRQPEELARIVVVYLPMPGRRALKFLGSARENSFDGGDYVA